MGTDISANQSSVRPDSRDPRLTTFIRLGLFFLVIAAIWFAASGRLDTTMAWLYLVFYALTALVATLVAPLDQELIEERTQIKEGAKSWDKPIVIIGSLLTPLGFIVLAGLDTRFGWSPPISLALQVAGLIAVVAGNLLGAWAVASNKFYGRFVRRITDNT